MSISIFYTLVPQVLSDFRFQQALQKLPPFQQNKIQRYFRKADAYAGLFGKLLLIKHLQGSVFTLDDLKYTAKHRPYLEGGADFNISHSERCVICAYCKEGRLGIDLEKIKPIEQRYFLEQWTLEELQYIEKEGLEAFYRCWTRKEAIIKADGKGLGIMLNNFSVRSDEVILHDQKWFLYPVSVPEGYISHLAFHQKIVPSEIHVQKIDFEELINEQD